MVEEYSLLRTISYVGRCDELSLITSALLSWLTESQALKAVAVVTFVTLFAANVLSLNNFRVDCTPGQHFTEGLVLQVTGCVGLPPGD